MKQCLYLSVSMWAALAGAGCAQLLGIESSSAGPDTTPVDGNPITPPGDGPGGDGGNTTACAPLPSFGPVAKYIIADAIGLAVGDVNRDTIKDLVVVTRSQTASDVQIFNGTMGGASGTFGTLRQLHPGSPTAATGVLVADVDADGALDIVTWDGMSPIGQGATFTVSVHRQNTTGTFLAAQTFSVPGVEGVVAGKLNADTRADLVIQSRSTSGGHDTFPYVASTTTAGAFTKGTLIATGMDLTVSHVTDIDQDGLDDVAFTRMAGGLALSFNDNAQTPGSFTPAAVGAGGVDDASFGHYGSTTRRDVVIFGLLMPGGILYAQISPRVFEMRSLVVDKLDNNGSHTPGEGMKSVDLNGDGRDDVVGTRNAAIQCPTAGTFFPQPMGSGHIQLGDMNNGPGVAVFTDLNGNGKLDLIDLPGSGGIAATSVEVWLQ